jgi:hypothetical protein
MKHMHEFYSSLPINHPILAARKEYLHWQKIFEHEPTSGEEIPSVLTSTTRLRSELEDFPDKPSIVDVYIGLLSSDVNMMRAVMKKVRDRNDNS